MNVPANDSCYQLLSPQLPGGFAVEDKQIAVVFMTGVKTQVTTCRTDDVTVMCHPASVYWRYPTSSAGP